MCMIKYFKFDASFDSFFLPIRCETVLEYEFELLYIYSVSLLVIGYSNCHGVQIVKPILISDHKISGTQVEFVGG